jgi:hypothetical protein
VKAWLVRVKDRFCATVVFAETRGKAKSLALSTDCCEDADFCDIEVHRESQMDKYYVEGKKEMDWFNSKDRLVLVKDCGFRCDEDYFEPEDCETCSAKEYCDMYIDYLESEVAE